MALTQSWERYNRTCFHLEVGAPAWRDSLEPKSTGKQKHAAPAIHSKPIRAWWPSVSEGSHTGSTAESSEVPLVRRKHLRRVGSAGDPSGGEGQLGGGDQGKGLASPDISSHGQSRRGGMASVEYDFWFTSSDVDDVTGPSMRGFEGLGEASLHR